MDGEGVEYADRYRQGCHMSSQSVGPESLRGLINVRGDMQICLQKVSKNAMDLRHWMPWSKDRRLGCEQMDARWKAGAVSSRITD